MKDINAKERGRASFGRSKARQPMNDVRFVELMYETVKECVNGECPDHCDKTPRELKTYYILEWKGGWDEARAETEKSVAKKKTKKKTKIIRKRKAKK